MLSALKKKKFVFLVRYSRDFKYYIDKEIKRNETQIFVLIALIPSLFLLRKNSRIQRSKKGTFQSS